MKKSKVKNDIFLIIAIIAVAIAALSLFAVFSKPGDYVVVNIDGIEANRYPLSDNLKTDIITGDGNINTLVIEDGRAYVSYADCPDKICVSHRKISRDGESIVCLPHKLVISIEKVKNKTLLSWRK